MAKLTREERMQRYPSITFTCAWCHAEVTTDSTEKVDKRTRFCCAHCERQWWRKETRHPTHLTRQFESMALADVDKYSHGNERQQIIANMVSDEDYEAIRQAMNSKEQQL